MNNSGLLFYIFADHGFRLAAFCFSIMELFQHVLQLLRNRQAEVGGVLQDGEAVVGDRPEDDRRAEDILALMAPGAPVIAVDSRGIQAASAITRARLRTMLTMPAMRVSRFLFSLRSSAARACMAAIRSSFVRIGHTFLLRSPSGRMVLPLIPQWQTSAGVRALLHNEAPGCAPF